MASRCENHGAVLTSTKKNTAANYQEGRKGEIFFGFTHAKLALVYLHSLQLCVPTGPNAQIEMGCYVNGVESVFQLFECCFYHSVRNL